MNRRTQRRGWLRFLSLITLSALAFCTIHLSPFLLDDCTAIEFTPVQTPSQGYQPQFQVSGSKIYYIWHEYDGPFRQIFTAEMNADGSGWRAEKRTSGQFDKVFPQLHVAGSKIYYVWQQPDATKTRQIWTAEMNVDGTGWNATKRTSTSFDKFEPQLQIIEDKIYFVWRESDGVHYQIWTGLTKRDGTGWQAFKRTATPFDKHNPQLDVQGREIYLAWHEADRPDWRKAKYQIWTASMKIDGTGWQGIQRTKTPFDKYTPQLQVVGDKIYYVWEESDGKYRQIWTAVTGNDGTGWRGEKRTRSPRGKYDPQFQIVGNKAYYVWHEDHGRTEPILVAIETLKEVSK